MSGRRFAGPVVAGTLALCAVAVRAEIPPGDSCARCHAESESPAFDVEMFFVTDVHARAGFSCVDCHGGDPSAKDEDEAMSEEAGFVGAPDRTDIPDLCGRCHSDPEYMRGFAPGLPVDQLRLYRSSGHGQANLRGDRAAATCVDCHRTHDIRPAAEPKSSVHARQVAATCGVCHADAALMSRYGLPADPVERYQGSVHGEALGSGRDPSAPTCNDCHGDHGALPPEVGSVFAMCGHCHVHNRELYAGSGKRRAFEDIGEPGCVACHDHHGVRHPDEAMLSLDPGARCAECHEDDGSEASNTILGMRSALDSLRVALNDSEDYLEKAEQKGMYVTDIRFRFQETRQLLFRARTEVHRFDTAALGVICAEGMASAGAVEAEARAALDEYRFRRNGLALASVVISVFAFSLWRKIRSIEAGAG